MTTGNTGSALPCKLALCLVAAFTVAFTTTGCVERRFIIESNVPNAQVYIDNKPVGVAPAHAPFDYYGKYNITIVYPGYETFSKNVEVEAPWYSYPPIDFVTEVLWPFIIRDNKRFYFELHEQPRTRIDELLNNAEALRQRADQLPAPEHPAPPKGPAILGPAPVPQAPGFPLPGPQPGNMLPPARPLTDPPVGTLPGGPAAPPPGVDIPSVLP